MYYYGNLREIVGGKMLGLRICMNIKLRAMTPELLCVSDQKALHPRAAKILDIPFFVTEFSSFLLLSHSANLLPCLPS